MAKEVIVTADKVRKRKLFSRTVKIALLALLLLLIILYIILGIVYDSGRFTVSLDPNADLESGLAIFDNLKDPVGKRKLYATSLKFMDNISYKWLPENVDAVSDGSHNGENYIAYSFYVQNQGKKVISYYYEMIIDDVIKNVDEAIRIRIYRNGKDITYAKRNSLSGNIEPNTMPFKNIKGSPETIILEEVRDFKPKDLDRYTVLVWLEGDDPQCTDPLIGGELKMHMVITEKHIEES